MQFNGIVNFVIFALTTGYILSIYYVAMLLSHVCGPEEVEENDSRNEVIPPRPNQVEDQESSMDDVRPMPIRIRHSINHRLRAPTVTKRNIRKFVAESIPVIEYKLDKE